MYTRSSDIGLADRRATRYGIGVRIEETLYLKKIDEDFFAIDE